MARIPTYQKDIYISDLDRIIGTDGDTNELVTKNFFLGDIAEYVIDKFIDPDAVSFTIPVLRDTQDTLGANATRITSSIMSQDVNPDGTKITIAGLLEVDKETKIKGKLTEGVAVPGQLVLNSSLNATGITIKAPLHADLPVSYTMELPNDIGTAGAQLTTDGISKVYWADPEDDNLTVTGDFGQGTIDLDTQVLNIVGGANVATTMLNQTLTINADGFITGSGTTNTLPMWGTTGEDLVDSRVSQGGGTIYADGALTIAGQLNVDAAATFDTSIAVTGDVQIDTLTSGYIPYSDALLGGALRASGFYQVSAPTLSDNAIGLNTTQLDSVFGEYPDFRVASRSLNDPGVLDLFRPDGDVVAGDRVGILQYSLDDNANYAVAQIEVKTIGNSGSGNSGGSKLCIKTSENTSGAIPTERLCIDNAQADFSVPVNVTSAAQSSFAGQVTIPETPVTDTDAASKAYVDLQTLSAEVVEVPVKNLQGSALTKGDPVYISGSVAASGRLEVQLADASNAAKMPALGLLKQDLGINEEGFAVVTGKLRNLPTSPIDGQTPLPNDVIYVKASGTTGAALTLTKPTGSSLIQNMGKVGRVSTSNSGTFVVSSILRTNDIPNLTPGKIWVGSTGNTVESSIVNLSDSEGLMTLEGTMKAEQVTVKGNSQPLILAKSTTSNAHITMRLDGESAGFISSKENHIGIGGTSGYSTNNLNIARGNGYVGVKQKLPLAPLHVKNNGEAIRLESTGGNVCSIDFRQGAAKRGHLEFDNSVDTLEIKTTNPSGTESEIKFSTAIGVGAEAVERMRIRNNQVIIGNPISAPSTKELCVNGGIHATGDLFVGDDVSIGGRCDADSYKLKGLNTPPATATSPGVNGEIRYTSDYIYVCVQNNVWKRTALTTW